QTGRNVHDGESAFDFLALDVAVPLRRSAHRGYAAGGAGNAVDRVAERAVLVELLEHAVEVRVLRGGDATGDANTVELACIAQGDVPVVVGSDRGLQREAGQGRRLVEDVLAAVGIPRLMATDGRSPRHRVGGAEPAVAATQEHAAHVQGKVRRRRR